MNREHLSCPAVVAGWQEAVSSTFVISVVVCERVTGLDDVLLAGNALVTCSIEFQPQTLSLQKLAQDCDGSRRPIPTELEE